MKVEPDVFRKELQSFAAEMGASVFGIADLDLLKKQFPDVLKNVGEGFTRAIVVGIRLQKCVLDGIDDKPTPLYFHNYRQVNYQLDGTACLIADRIQRAGYRSIAIPASQIVKKSPMEGHVSHKLLGWAAGIGFFGRNNLLVHPRYGSQMRFVSILCDMPLPADSAIKDDCGDCVACVSVCPAKAIATSRSDFNLPACFAKLTEFTRIQFVGQHVCGVCLKACQGRKQ